MLYIVTWIDKFDEEEEKHLIYERSSLDEVLKMVEEKINHNLIFPDGGVSIYFASYCETYKLQPQTRLLRA